MAKRRILYFGMTGLFSTVPLRRLLEAEFEIEAVILPRPQADTRGMFLLPTFDAPDVNVSLPMIKMPVVDNIHVEASRFGLSIFSLGGFTESVAGALRGLEADVFVFACFPWKVPQEILDIPRDGCINLHPSLLPAYRGPEPLFWQFVLDEPHKGVSVHFMDEELDKGDLIAQKEVEYELVEIDYHDIEVQAANKCADLLIEALEQGEIKRTAQSKRGASYYGTPVAQDFELPGNTSLERFEFLNRILGEFGTFNISS